MPTQSLQGCIHGVFPSRCPPCPKLDDVTLVVWLRVFLVLLAFLLPPGSAYSNGLPDFTELVEKNAPAVVNISTVYRGKSRLERYHLPDNVPIPEEGPLGDLFRRFFDGEEELAPEEVESLGSGFIISPDGYILTNHHVVDGADEILVRLNNRDAYEAKLVGSDEASDIALLKVEASNLPVVKIGDSRKLKIGAWVLAIGSPFGFESTVTAGIVSAKGRSLPSENYVPYIQTDVAINPGNSGGPLFNMDGEVVGVNSQIFSRSGGFMGLSFAVPIELAMNVVRQIRDQGHVSRGYLGVLRCPPWRAKRRRVVPGSREATRDTRRAEGAKGDPKGASERGVQSYGRPVCSRNELAMLWRNAG